MPSQLLCSWYRVSALSYASSSTCLLPQQAAAAGATATTCVAQRLLLQQQRCHQVLHLLRLQEAAHLQGQLLQLLMLRRPQLPQLESQGNSQRQQSCCLLLRAGPSAVRWMFCWHAALPAEALHCCCGHGCSPACCLYTCCCWVLLLTLWLAVHCLTCGCRCFVHEHHSCSSQRQPTDCFGRKANKQVNSSCCLQQPAKQYLQSSCKQLLAWRIAANLVMYQ
jgi:hypothetical protein